MAKGRHHVPVERLADRINTANTVKNSTTPCEKPTHRGKMPYPNPAKVYLKLEKKV
jgi:hypothetical protein